MRGTGEDVVVWMVLEEVPFEGYEGVGVRPTRESAESLARAHCESRKAGWKPDGYRLMACKLDGGVIATIDGYRASGGNWVWKEA